MEPSMSLRWEANMATKEREAKRDEKEKKD